MTSISLVPSGGVITTNVNRIYDTMEFFLGRPMTPTERAALQNKLLNVSFTGVQPGDLITADLFNAMRADINDLAMRLSMLEGNTGGPVITDIPAGKGIEVKQIMRIFGRNFEREPRNNRITIGGKEIPGIRQTSTETELIIPVPDIFDRLPQRLDVVVERLNGRRSNPFPVMILPADEKQAGTFTFGPAKVPPGKIKIGDVLEISWPITARTLFDDVLHLELFVQNADGATQKAWLDNHKFISGDQIKIAFDGTETATLQVKVPAQAVSAELILKATSELNPDISPASQPVQIKVNAEIEESDERIRIALRTATPSGLIKKGKVKIDGVERDGLQVIDKGDFEITIVAKDTRQGGPNADFVYEVLITKTGGNWKLGGLVPEKSPGIAAGQDASTTILLAASGATGDTALLRINVKQTANSIGAYTAFATIPLQFV